MIEFNFLKQLKKRIRRKRRPLWVLGSFAFIAVLAAIGTAAGEEPASASPFEKGQAAAIGHNFTAMDEKSQRDIFLRMLEMMTEPLAVEQHTTYVCGEELRPLGRMMPRQVAALLEAHPDWSASLGEASSAVIIERSIDDLSENCKRNAYMGVDRNGYFSLFEGEPSKEKVLRTFFQIDVHYMESSLPQKKLDELAQGIRIKDIDEYNSVLSTFSDYATEEGRNVLKSVPQDNGKRK